MNPLVILLGMAVHLTALTFTTASPTVDTMMTGQNPVPNVGTRSRYMTTDGLGFMLPANGDGRDVGFGSIAAPMIPGVQLPGEQNQTKIPAGRELFNPFGRVVDTTFYKQGAGNTQSIGYGLGVQGTNALNIPVNRLYPYMRDQTLQRRLQEKAMLLPQNPFTTVIGDGFETERVDHMTAGKLSFPIVRQDGQVVRGDVNGFFLTNQNPAVANNQGELTVPMADQRHSWTMKTKIVAIPDINREIPIQYGHFENPANPFDIPVGENYPAILGSANPLNPINPAYVG